MTARSLLRPLGNQRWLHTADASRADPRQKGTWFGGGNRGEGNKQRVFGLAKPGRTEAGISN